MSTGPDKFNLAKDVDLIEHKKSFVVEILTVEKMTEDNYKKLICFDVEPFEKVVTKYGCDICTTHSSKENPIYTNSKSQGVDICSKCVNTAFATMKPLDGWYPGPIYSLKEMCELNGKNES